MKTLFQNSLLKFSLLSEEQAILLFEWTDKTREMSYEDFQIACNTYAGFAWQYQVRHLLVDTRQFYFSLPAAFEQWREEQLNPRYHHLGVKKFAYLTQPEFLPHMKDIPAADGTFETRNFASAEEAMKWLTED